MIKIVRLVTGEEIIGDVEIDNMQTYTITNPLLIEQGSFANYEVAMKFTDYLMFSSETSVLIPTKNVITQYKPLESFEKYYITYIEYSNRVTKTSINEHALYAVSELKYLMEEATKTRDSFNDMLVKYGKNKKLN